MLSVSRANRSALFTALLAIGLSTQAAAQDTTSAIRGFVSDAGGLPVADASVEVVDLRTGATRTLESNSAGAFYASNLPVGGPYRVTVDDNRSVTIETISLGEVYNLSIDLGGSGPAEEILVIGQSDALADVAPGPSATFGGFELETSVAYDRDIKDVYSLDPRMNLDGGTAVNCIGKHPRYNSISLDGVAQNDRFGLNSNGYATATGMPFPYESIAQVAAELAPFDVNYGGFTACNINAVTKSGTNEWTGTGFYELTGDRWRGDSLTEDGRTSTFSTVDYEEEKYGFSVGGPIVEDRLFFFAAYEETEEPRFLSMGYAGSGNGVERPWLSENDYDRIRRTAVDLYDYDPGGQPVDGAQTEQKYMIRLDWNINDAHSLAGIYNFYDGIQDRASDGDNNEFEFSNHFYQKGAELETVILKLFSQWTDAFSTEIFVNTNTMIDTQVTTGPGDFADFQVNIARNTVYLGADDSRQANRLNWESSFLKFSGEYLAGNHLLTFGFERDDLSVFNLFVQHSRGGEYDFFDDSAGNPAHCDTLTAQGRFDDPACALSGIDRFELGRPSRVYYGSGGGTNDAQDAAANFGNVLNTLYFQDEWYLPDYALTLTAGLRYEWFTSDDRPRFNQTFTSANNGLRNDGNVDGLDLLMPRLGFTWEARDNLTVRGGLGLYSGGNPNVWLSNAWSNDGITNVQLQWRNLSGAESIFGNVPLAGGGRPGYDVPAALVDQVLATTEANANDSRLVLIDPGYEQPAEWKLALGGTYYFANGINVDTDYIFSRQQKPAYYLDVSQQQVGTTAAGQPIYDFVTGSENFMLTNSGQKPEAHSLSLVARQRHDWGLDWMLGYAWTDAEDVSPMTSFVAASNFDNLALVDLVEPMPGTSNYVSPHRFTARLSYGRDFIAGHETRITALFYGKEGHPQSHVMSSADLEGDGFYGRHLLYVPGANDPNVVAGPDFDLAAFSAFVEREGYGAGFVGRNANHADWSSRLDLRIDQQLPLLFGARARGWIKIYNLLNMIDDELGLQYDGQFFSQQVVTSSLNDRGQYVFERFRDRNITDLLEQRSLWELRLGIQFEF
ncbi:MAG: TonB-dependent receptor [Gammaproteobacteria bacterium]|nr:TonB-dependent receptor [Gammaproteobacteria bacterium]MYE99629.1 TonB-dependent receptor [Gammaproteobacteria bacterium]MYG95985.1 TonB-dependent receptor [Gammaproteobacteria bacterium]